MASPVAAADLDDRTAVERIFALIAGNVDLTALLEVLGADADDTAAVCALKSSELMKLLTAALEQLGPRQFLERTACFVNGTGMSQPRAKPRRQKVAIYGGAFDPITNAHLTCAAEIVHSKCADEVWLVPCGPRLDKPNLKTAPVDRYVMSQIAVNTVFSRRFPINVSDIECFSEEASMTYDLLCSLRERHPEKDFCFIIGSDWLQPGSDMSKWESRNWNWKEGDPESEKFIVTGHKMLAEFDFIVIKRAGYDVPSTKDDPTGLKKFGPRLSWLSMPDGATFIEGNSSSTEIRKRTMIASRIRSAVGSQALNMIDGLVPPAVLGYIVKRGFYQPDEAPPTARKRVAIYGGAFDPITNAHLECAAQILHAHSNGIEEVWFVPGASRPDMKTSPLDRLTMCRIAVGTYFRFNFRVFASDIEVFSDEPAYTYDLLRKLSAKHPNIDFVCVLGSEWLDGASATEGVGVRQWRSKNWSWKPGDPAEERTIVTGEQMLAEYDFLILRRHDATHDLSAYGPRLAWHEMPEGTTFIHGNLSSGTMMSSEVRKRAAAARRRASVWKEEADHTARSLIELEGLVPHAVLNYMRRQGLYEDA
eukprot:TRINITY_DN23617_c0_g1_i1.p1 TRINITY_DN23617_c0_g1~~TRINITY_DN23617_c0_g1_i1.p1  ORF type:complete len:591 (-),score=93.94 TRINITY_DN23617_c0_g1_i1:101-1873(-)